MENMTSTVAKKRGNLKLSLDTKQKTFDDASITITQNSGNTYVIQNHPHLTDLTESASSTNCKFGKNFFKGSDMHIASDDQSFLGDAFYVVQRSNGKEMQDKYKVRLPSSDSNLTIFGVYDGHSTHIIADVLAKNLDEYIIQNVNKKMDLQSSIIEGFKKIEQEVIDELKISKPRGGSTALCAVIKDKMIVVANLGDSQAVVFRNNDFLCLSSIHDLRNESEIAEVEKRGGAVLKNRLEGELAISRSIGDINFKRFMSSDPELIQHQITEQDEYLIMGTDGYWNGIEPKMTLDLIRKFKETSKNGIVDIKAMGEFLIEEACVHVKTKKDNMTLLIVNLKDMFPKKF